MKINGNITLSRVRCSTADDYISIRLADEDARITFVEVQLDLAGLAHMLTGSASVDCSLDVFSLENVGKVKEQEKVSFELPEDTPFTEEKSAAIAMLSEIDDEWTYSTYLGSQDTFYSNGGKRCFRTLAAKWVDKDEAE